MEKRSDEKKNKYLRRALAAVLLVAVIIASVAFMDRYLCIPNTSDQIRIINLHKEPENSIDVLFIGSSATYSGFASAYAYEKYGFTSFPYAVGGSTCTMWKPALQDTLRRQQPKLVVVDVFGGGYEPELLKSRVNQVYTVMANTPLSKEKVATAKELASVLDGASAPSFIVPFLRYHNRVPSNLRKLDDRLEIERTGISPLKGIENITRERNLKKVDEASFTDDSVPLDEDTEAVIKSFMDYCKEKDIQVLFVKFPTVLTEEDPGELMVNLRANRVLEIADEYGFATLNMQKRFHEIGLIENKDYYNHGHTNTRGQKKVTAYLGGYIQNELGTAPSDLDYDLEAEWDEAIDYYHAYDELNEEMIQAGKAKELWDRPDLVRELTDRMEQLAR